MARNKNNNIDKAMQALGDALKIEEIGQEIQLPGEEVSTERTRIRNCRNGRWWCRS